MIGHLRGVLLRIAPDEVLLDVGGVGYAVRTPLSTYYQLERLGGGEEAALLIHTQVRDDAIELFGFVTDEELALFRKLIAVSGIGPRLAQVILSGMAPGDVLGALSTGDIARLVSIPGIGKKTAERMVLELRDAAAEILRSSDQPPQPAQTDQLDLVAALVQLGYRPADAERAVQKVRQDHSDAEFGELLRLSLRSLSKV